ncbi:hypothetical protein PUN28_009518 [Cardiocondyla obscurior]|uniref:Uncharacterized protein n=1 Tax=Cardiocondyla obscurior TaxID=286306 RepID=A0AAW2FU02_9HYME
MCWLGSGHTSLRQSLLRFNTVDSPNCPLCDTEETPNRVAVYAGIQIWLLLRRRQLANEIIESYTYHILTARIIQKLIALCQNLACRTIDDARRRETYVPYSINDVDVCRRQGDRYTNCYYEVTEHQ